MKLKEKMAVDAVEARDLISNENRRHYGEAYLAGFEAARELALKQYITCHNCYCDDCGDGLRALGEGEAEC